MELEKNEQPPMDHRFLCCTGHFLLYDFCALIGYHYGQLKMYFFGFLFSKVGTSTPHEVLTRRREIQCVITRLWHQVLSDLGPVQTLSTKVCHLPLLSIGMSKQGLIAGFLPPLCSGVPTDTNCFISGWQCRPYLHANAWSPTLSVSEYVLLKRIFGQNSRVNPSHFTIMLGDIR